MLAHRFYTQAAQAAVQCYVEVFDSPSEAEKKEEEEDLSALSPAEKKKAKAKAKREAAKKAKEAFKKTKEDEKKDAAGGKGGKGGGGAAEKKKAKAAAGGKDADDDPDGAKLLLKDPLAEAWRVEKTLLLNNGGEVDTHLLCYDVAFRRKRFLMALRGLKLAQAIEATSPGLHTRVASFYTFVEASQAAGAGAADGEGGAGAGALGSQVLEVIKGEQESMLGGKPGRSLVEFAKAYTAANGGRVLHRRAAALAWATVAPKDKGAALAHMTSLDGGVAGVCILSSYSYSYGTHVCVCMYTYDAYVCM